jgi:hypothetical protein
MLTIDPRKRITISELLHELIPELGFADFWLQQVIEA